MTIERGPRRTQTQTERDIEGVRRQHEERRIAEQAAARATALSDSPEFGKRAAAPLDPMAQMARSLRHLRWVVAAIAIPVVTTTKLVVSHIYERAEEEVVTRLERARLSEDVKSLTTRLNAATISLRDAEEALRRLNSRMDDWHADRMDRPRRVNNDRDR